MRNKKLVSTVVASALVATTMAMPVMAAGESGTVDVDVSTKTGVLRVAVPTNMAMQIDQFEITQTGAQIASGEFDMVNHSEMPVKVDVTSTADLGTGITLVATKAGAEDSTTEGEAWLAVAAKTADGSYDDLTTGTVDNAVTENYWDLADNNANVTTFDATSKAAKQSFYLAKAAEKDGSNVDAKQVYTYAIPTDAGKYKESYVQFYALTPVAGTTDDGDDSNTTEQEALEGALETDDVYEVAMGIGDGGASVAAVDGETMTKHDKGSTGVTWAKTNEYYTAAQTSVEASAVTANSKYMYVAMNTDGGKAGFTYVGKLSNANEKTWTSQNDIKKITIAYTIKGITASSYEAVEDNCTYGLYTESTESKEIFSFTELAADKNEVVISGVADDAIVTKVLIKRADGTDVDITANTTGAERVSWLIKEGENGEQIFKVSATIITNTNNAGADIEVEFSDGNKGTLSIPA